MRNHPLSILRTPLLLVLLISASAVRAQGPNGKPRMAGTVKAAVSTDLAPPANVCVGAQTSRPAHRSGKVTLIDVTGRELWNNHSAELAACPVEKLKVNP